MGRFWVILGHFWPYLGTPKYHPFGQNPTAAHCFWASLAKRGPKVVRFWAIPGDPLCLIEGSPGTQNGSIWVIFGPSQGGPPYESNLNLIFPVQNPGGRAQGPYLDLFWDPFWVTFGHPRAQIYVNPNLNMSPPEYRGSQI